MQFDLTLTIGGTLVRRRTPPSTPTPYLTWKILYLTWLISMQVFSAAGLFCSRDLNLGETEGIVGIVVGILLYNE